MIMHYACCVQHDRDAGARRWGTYTRRFPEGASTPRTASRISEVPLQRQVAKREAARGAKKTLLYYIRVVAKVRRSPSETDVGPGRKLSPPVKVFGGSAPIVILPARCKASRGGALWRSAPYTIGYWPYKHDS